MQARALLVTQLLVLLTLGVIHVSALQYALYWHYVWLDTLTHFLGGVWVALFICWIRARYHYAFSFADVIAGVLVAGVGWELFEYAGGVPREANFALDTSIDLAMDVIGGVVGVYSASKLS